jgi:hypothetical protein
MTAAFIEETLIDLEQDPYHVVCISSRTEAAWRWTTWLVTGDWYEWSLTALKYF